VGRMWRMKMRHVLVNLGGSSCSLVTFEVRDVRRSSLA